VIATVLVFTPLSFAIDKSNRHVDGYFSDNSIVFQKHLKGFVCFEVLTGVIAPWDLITCDQIEEIVTKELTKRDIVVGDCDKVNPFSRSEPYKWYEFRTFYFAYISVDLETITLNKTGDYIYVIKFYASASGSILRFPKVAHSTTIWEIPPNGFYVDTGTIEEIKDKLKEITNNFADDYKAKVEWSEDNRWDMK